MTWTLLTDEWQEQTECLDVPGGKLYRTTRFIDSGVSGVAMVFVPTPVVFVPLNKGVEL